MERTAGFRITLMAALLVCGSARTAAPQAGAAAVDACASAAAAGREHEARALASTAETEYRAAIAADPHDVEGRVALARTLVQCVLPFEGMLSRGGIVGRANQLLEEALEIDETHWAARFTLALNHFHAPEFLGRTGDAIREFERLLELQGDASAPPIYAETYLRLGDLYARRGRAADALAVWRRGSARFPDHAALLGRLHARGEITPGSASDGPSDAAPAYSVEGVVVSASAVRMDDPRGGIALRRLDVLLTPGGAADLMSALRTAPGTTAASEGSDLYVRGGDPAETPVWIDGVRIAYPGRYETLHGGVFGILDPAVLRSAYFSSGGFSARYGNALSGVLDVQTASRPSTRAAIVSLNTVQAGTMVQTPLGGAAGAWLAIRASDGTMMLAMHGRGDEFATPPRALEGMAAVAWAPRPSAELKATALLDRDESAREIDAWGHRGAFHSRGENRLIGVSARLLNRDATGGLRAGFAATSRTSGFAFGVLDRERSDRSVGARVDADLAANPATRLRAGFEATALHARHAGVLPVTDALGPGSEAAWSDSVASTAHLGGFVEAEVSPYGGLGLIAGVRADRLPGEEMVSLDPRLALALRRGDWTLRLGGGTFHQGRWRTRYALPDALTPAGTPRRATHLAGGIERHGEPALRLEAYRKRYGDYVPAGEGPPIVAGMATGADLIVRWSEPRRLSGWVTYSLLRGRVELHDGQVVPSNVDVTHSLTGVARYRLAEQWQLGATARLASGRPYGAAGAPPNAERLPAYRRIDSRLTRFWSIDGRSLVGYLELLNVLDRANVAAYTSDSSGERRPVHSFFADRTAVVGLSLTL